MSDWSATVLGDATTRGAPIVHIHMRSVITVSRAMATILAMVVATMVLATDITADRASEVVSARSASAFGNPSHLAATSLRTRRAKNRRVRYVWTAADFLRFGDVRFWSLADICSAKGHVRFAPNSDRKSRHAANGHVRFTPESRHVQCKRRCLLWAKSGHRTRTNRKTASRRSLRNSF